MSCWNDPTPNRMSPRASVLVIAASSLALWVAILLIVRAVP